MNVAQAKEFLGEDDFTLFADGLEEAFLGLGRRCGQVIAIYSEPQAILILMKQMREGCPSCNGVGGKEECDHWVEAREYFEFNVVGAWMGDGTPLWLDYDGELMFE